MSINSDSKINKIFILSYQHSRFFYLAGSLFRSGSVFLIQIIAVRILGIELYGAGLILLAPFFAIQIYIGTFSAELFSRMLSSPKGGADSKVSFNVLTKVMMFELKANSWVFTAIFFFSTALISNIDVVSRALNDTSILLLCMFGVSTIFYQIFNQIYLLKNGLLRLSACYFIEAIVSPSLFFILLIFDASIDMYIMALIIKNILSLILLLSFFKMEWIMVKNKENYYNQSQVSSAPIPFHNLSMILKILWTNLDVAAVGYISGSASAGEFKIIKSISSLPSLIAAPWWNSIRSKVINFISRNNLNKLREIVSVTALQLSPLVLICFVSVFFSKMFFEKIYLLEIDSEFIFVFGFYFFTFMIANVITAWGRYIQVVTGSLALSFWLNLFMVLILLTSFLVNHLLTILIPVPIIIGFGMLVCSIFYWNWLRRLSN